MTIWRRKERKGERPGERADDWERDPFEDPFFSFREDFFRDFDEQLMRIRAYMNAMMEKALHGELGPEHSGGPYVYGWSMRVGPDGVPHIQTFGNVRPGAIPHRMLAGGEGGACPAGTFMGPGVREPLTDVCEDEKSVTITAEMPGIEKNDIELETGEDFMVIKVEKGPRRYYKEIRLPARVLPDTAKAKYNNGVLDITVQKAEAGKKGTKVKIE
ncbi:MAG: archaeal heat shock protein Hsp20 [Thermoplasmata archaeon]